jgi:hypothetical protein
MVLFGKVPRQLMNATQMQLPPPNHLQNAGKSTGRTAGPNALRSHSLRHPKPLRTKRKHRRIRILEVQLSPVDLPDVNQQTGRAASVRADERSEVPKQSPLTNTLHRRGIHQPNTRVHTF